MPRVLIFAALSFCDARIKTASELLATGYSRNAPQK
jgi:hypothetical protein